MSLHGGVPIAHSCAVAGPLLPSAEQIGRALDRGDSLEEALAEVQIPSTEKRLMVTAHRSGQLDQALDELADQLERAASQHDELISGLLYPAVVLHLIPIVLNIGDLVRSPPTFFAGVSSWYLLGWSAAAMCFFLHRRWRHHEWYRKPLRKSPLVGPLLANLAHRDLFRPLLWLYTAGVPFGRALADAIRTVDPLLHLPEFESLRASIRSGATIEGTLSCLRRLDPMLLGPLLTAASIGGLETALRQTLTQLERTIVKQSQRFAKTCVFVLYASAVIAVLMTAIRFYSGYFGQLT